MVVSLYERAGSLLFVAERASEDDLFVTRFVLELLNC